MPYAVNEMPACTQCARINLRASVCHAIVETLTVWSQQKIKSSRGKISRISTMELKIFNFQENPNFCLNHQNNISFYASEG